MTDTIDSTAAQLRSAGLPVAVSVQEGRRSTDEAEADRIVRQTDRSTAMDDRAARLAAAADTADRRARELASRVPLGQPILVGHHSEGRMRRHYATVEAASRNAGQAYTDAKEATRQADAARSTTRARYSPVTVANRIEALLAEIRSTERDMSGHTRTVAVLPNGQRHVEEYPPASGTRRHKLSQRLKELTEQLTYWRRVRDDHVAAGRLSNHSADTVCKGDEVMIRGTWYVVQRANKKTVTVPSPLGNWTHTAPYHEIQQHRPARTREPDRSELLGF